MFNADVTRTFAQAIAEVAGLLDADQERIGRPLLSHVEKLQRLREQIDAKRDTTEANGWSPGKKKQPRSDEVV
ncbi:MAG TPA: hypothetical protein VKX28_13250 [Xanthobacteraceae bacterium]|nr:hypothetical protein [Xanthobacteraceae bacterium]